VNGTYPPEGHDQRDADQERRHRGQAGADRRDGPVEPAALAQRREDPGTAAEHDREGQREDREREVHRERLADRRGDRDRGEVGDAEVAGQRVPEPGEVLHQEGAVQAELVVELRDLRGRRVLAEHRRGRVRPAEGTERVGREGGDEEHRDRHGDQAHDGSQ
jgi:hypothetical protein